MPVYGTKDTRGWYAQARLHGASSIYLDPANEYSRSGFGVIDLSACYILKHVEQAVYANNVANKHYDSIGFLNGLVTIYSPPREVGVRVSWKL